MIGCFYSSIVKAVVAHEKSLRAQAKKMNVDSLRSAGSSEESAEFKIAKVAITNVLLWFCIWTPYATVSSFPSLGLAHLLTPPVAAIPGFIGKHSQTTLTNSSIAFVKAGVDRPCQLSIQQM